MPESEKEPNDTDTQRLLRRYGIAPAKARAQISRMMLGMGVPEEHWDELLKERWGSHESRALILIARSDEPQLLEDAVTQLRLKERAQDIEAFQSEGSPIDDNVLDEIITEKERQDLRHQTEELGLAHEDPA